MRRRRSSNGHSKRNGHSRGILVYKSYVFRDKDPVIDELRTMVSDKGASYKEIHEESGIATGTLHNWFKGETRRPQSATVEAVGRSLGFRRKWVKMREHENI